MWPLQVNYGWNCVENGPLDEDIALQVTERGGVPALQRPCRRRRAGDDDAFEWAVQESLIGGTCNRADIRGFHQPARSDAVHR
jgi:hypothetical protein